MFGLAACDPPAPATWALGPDATRIHCVNRYNGAPWDIALDRTHNLGDGHPANFGARHIHWTSPGASNDLDAATGVLTVGRGSSTGGWVLTFSCTQTGRP